MNRDIMVIRAPSRNTFKIEPQVNTKLCIYESESDDNSDDGNKLFRKSKKEIESGESDDNSSSSDLSVQRFCSNTSDRQTNNLEVFNIRPKVSSTFCNENKVISAFSSNNSLNSLRSEKDFKSSKSQVTICKPTLIIDILTRRSTNINRYSSSNSDDSIKSIPLITEGNNTQNKVKFSPMNSNECRTTRINRNDGNCAKHEGYQMGILKKLSFKSISKSKSRSNSKDNEIDSYCKTRKSNKRKIITFQSQLNTETDRTNNNNITTKPNSFNSVSSQSDVFNSSSLIPSVKAGSSLPVIRENGILKNPENPKIRIPYISRGSMMNARSNLQFTKALEIKSQKNVPRFSANNEIRNTKGFKTMKMKSDIKSILAASNNRPLSLWIKKLEFPS